METACCPKCSVSRGVYVCETMGVSRSRGPSSSTVLVGESIECVCFVVDRQE